MPHSTQYTVEYKINLLRTSLWLLPNEFINTTLFFMIWPNSYLFLQACNASLSLNPKKHICLSHHTSILIFRALKYKDLLQNYWKEELILLERVHTQLQWCWLKKKRMTKCQIGCRSYCQHNLSIYHLGHTYRQTSIQTYIYMIQSDDDQ